MCVCAHVHVWAWVLLCVFVSVCVYVCAGDICKMYISYFFPVRCEVKIFNFLPDSSKDD